MTFLYVTNISMELEQPCAKYTFALYGAREAPREALVHVMELAERVRNLTAPERPRSAKPKKRRRTTTAAPEEGSQPPWQSCPNKL